MRFIATTDLPDAVPQFARLQHDEWHHLYPTWTVENYAHELRTASWDGELTESSHLAWFALDDHGTPVGVAMLLGTGELEPADEVEMPGPWFAGLVVEPASRSQGFGAGLLHHVMKQAAERGYRQLRLVTEGGTEYYESHGWVVERVVTLNSTPNTVMFTTVEI